MATRAAEAARPGSTYFVPGVRIVPLPALTRGTRDGCRCDAPPTNPAEASDAKDFATVHEDIIKVDVTMVANGSGEYTIELNNAFTELPADRRHREARLLEAWPDGRPFTPRFKYNDFAFFKFGMRLRIDLRYWPDPADSLAESDAISHRWVPMIQGPITDMRFSFGTGEGARLVITGEDDLAPLKDKGCTRTRYERHSEQEIVADVLSRAQYSIPLAEHDRWPPFARDRSRALAETHQEGAAYLEYLQKIAERLDFEVFVEFDNPNPESQLRIHFEPSRCRLRPDQTGIGNIYVLEHAKNLLSFRPTIKVRDLFTHVTIRGRHRVAGTPRRVDGVVRPEDNDLEGELFRDASRGDPELISGPEWRRKLYGANCQTDSNRTNVDNERAEVMAQAAYRKKAREFLTIHAETLGLPRLRPGRYVEVRGMRPPFDGFYYVDKTVHRYSVQGYRTEVDARRPGMPEPPYGEVREE